MQFVFANKKCRQLQKLCGSMSKNPGMYERIHLMGKNTQHTFFENICATGYVPYTAYPVRALSS